MSITAVQRVSTRSERLSLTTAIRCVTGCLTIGYVRSNGQYRHGRETVSVGVVTTDHHHELGNKVVSDLVYTVIIITVLRELAGGLEIYDDAILITDRLNGSVLDRGQGVCNYGQTSHTGCEVTANVSVVQSHLCTLVAVLVVHVVDYVQSIYIYICQPLHHIFEHRHELIILDHIAFVLTILRSNLLLGYFIDTAVQSVQHTFSKVCTSAEELHFLTNSHGGYAASDRIVITVCYTHQVVVLILDGRRLDGHLSAELFPCSRQSCGPQNGQVRLR